ncbi:MAG: YheV family putative metal-binding protein [Gammaproteobacteria bacterium]|nr:MAG: YheV family putative metal-binding protein [Gammaproteobacteria bacterium]
MRRFIAGAKCPQCEQVDTLFMDNTATGKRRECVRCGFHDALENLAPPAIPTRVERERAPAASSEPVRLVDPRKPV